VTNRGVTFGGSHARSSMMSSTSFCPAVEEVPAPFGEGLDSEVNTVPSYDVLSTSASAAEGVQPADISTLFSGEAYLLAAHAVDPCRALESIAPARSNKYLVATRWGNTL